jgi:uncharacterized protein (DUF58 family)
MISRRGWAVIAGAIGAMALALLTLNLLLLVVAWAVLLFAAVEILRFSRTSFLLRSALYERERSGPAARLALRGSGATHVWVRNTTGAGFWAELHDTTPDSVDVVAGASHRASWWPNDATMDLAYVFRPELRGTFSLGPTLIVAHDPAGFAFDTIALNTVSEFTVIPPMPLTASGQAGMRLRSRWLGSSAIRHRGYGTEFRSIRPYVPYDDIRSIAWKRSAQGQLFVREYEQESRQDIVLVVDVSQWMNAGVAGQSALDVAVEAGLTLVAFQARLDDRVGLLAFDTSKALYIPPSIGPAHRTRVAHALAGLAPRGARFDLPSAMNFLRDELRTRAHLFVFSAMATDFTPFHRAHAALRHSGHRLYLFVPQLPAFYPTPTNAVDEALLHLPSQVDAGRTQAAMLYLRSEGVPTFTYDRRGASARAVSVYSRIRTWGVGW